MDYRLRTPKRYRPNQRNRRLLRSWRGLRNLLLIPILGYIAYTIYFNQFTFRENFLGAADEIRQGVGDIIPPTATPYIDVSDEVVEAERAYRTGDYSLAIDNYRVVIQGAPNDLQSHYRLAFLLIITSDFGDDLTKLNEALEVSIKAINASPESPDGWAIRAMALVWLQRNGEAIAYASRALELNNDYVLAKAIIAQAYYQANLPETANTNIEAAVNYLREVGSEAPETVAIVFRTQGYILERQLDREGALAAYQRAIAAAPNMSFITVELAFTYIGLGESTEALGLLRSALDTNPRDSTVLYWIGTIYYGNGNIEDATQNFQRCVDVDSDNGPCLAMIGEIKFYSAVNLPQDQARIAYADSIPYFERAIAGGYTAPDVWWRLGRAYYWVGECPKAIEIFRQGLPIAEAEAYSVYEGSVESFYTGLIDCGASLNGS